jgi:hypothetical protein
VALLVTTLFFIATSARWVPAMAMVTACAMPRYRGSFMSVSSSVQQGAAGLAALLGGFIVDNTDGRITDYSRAGLLASTFAILGVILAGFLRPIDIGLASVDSIDSAGESNGEMAGVAPGHDDQQPAAPMAR